MLNAVDCEEHTDAGLTQQGWAPQGDGPSQDEELRQYRKSKNLWPEVIERYLGDRKYKQDCIAVCQTSGAVSPCGREWLGSSEGTEGLERSAFQQQSEELS